MLDIFKSDAFSVTSLTDAINAIPYVPTGLAPLFQETSVMTLTVAIENKEGVLTLVPPTPRGGPGTTIQKRNRSMLDIRVPHFERNDAVMAEEVQGVRAWGSETVLETVQGYVAQRLAEHSQDFETTAEYHRIGAVKGIVTYADGSTLDLFNLFGVSQETEVDFDLDNATPAAGALRKKCDTVVRLIAANLGGVPYSGVRAEVGDAFWDDLIAHKEVRETYLNQAQAAELRNGTLYQDFGFGGITWRNYRGAVGGTSFVNTDKAHLYPTGVPGMFRCVYAPADYMETVNTPGQRLYVKQYEMPNGKGIHLDVQTNALHYATRPKALIKGKRT
jgi:hypothetical protein